ncbi:protein CHLOROPLAST VESICULATION isoform X1 [Amaranthus tricolor]|uniref:protein CHLOROPLAST VESICULATION isoform X1 n=1 Tax=Amaranthus tricolor TaxID=29722 RepID=UPI0025900645|nr:protein CHLOROPLAST VESICULATION isoform X1 [Amaranthus tricolor]
MNISTICRFNALPPSSSPDPTSSTSLSTRKNFATRKSNEKSSIWSRKLMVIATTVIISLEVGDIVNNINGSSNSIMAMEFEIANNNNRKTIARWSDKRSCPPWQINSLETIVPENLPRPFKLRKWEGISYSYTKSAPSVNFFVIKSKKSCFSL